jgi:hypothetical protein
VGKGGREAKAIATVIPELEAAEKTRRATMTSAGGEGHGNDDDDEDDGVGVGVGDGDDDGNEEDATIKSVAMMSRRRSVRWGDDTTADGGPRATDNGQLR